MIFVDASVLVAILLREPDALELADRVEQAATRYYSAVGYWETVAALCRVLRVDPPAARERLDAFLGRFAFEIVPIGDKEAGLAVEAAHRYGRGRHPAALNMGDCFAYACAKVRGAKLLYKGGDFAKTDLA